MSRTKAELVLVLVVLAVSSSYLFTKLGMGSLQGFNLVALRFATAFIALGAFTLPRLLRANAQTIGAGVFLGFSMAAILALQAFGLDTVSTSEGSFLSSTTVGMVPLMLIAVDRKLPKPAVAAGSLLVLAGIYVLTGADLAGLTPGAVMYLASAAIYGVFVIAVDRFGPDVDLLAAGVFELAFAFVITLCISFAIETPRLPATGEEWACVLALGVVCSAIGSGVQPWAQQFTTPERYGVLFGLGPLFSAVLGYAVLGEQFAATGIIGAALILAGVITVVLNDRAGGGENRRYMKSRPLPGKARPNSL